MISLALAVLAAGLNAVSSVLQRKANIAEAEERAFGLRLLLHLVTRPVWLGGLAAMIGSFLLQATALGFGTLSAVEPVLVLELPLALILGSAVLHRRLPRRDWVSAATMAAGLALFIGVLAPSGGAADRVSTTVALTATVGTAAGVAVLVLAARTGPRRTRAALFGAAAGSGFGLTAGLMKLAVAKLSDHGPAGLFTAWQTYAMVAVGIASVGLEQAALNAGTLVAVQPGITLLDPLVSLMWGTVVAREQTRTGPILVLAAAGAALMVLAVIWLAQASAQASAPTSGSARPG